MINVRIRSGHGRWLLEIDGHGDDVVCAVVTAIEQSVAIQLDQLSQLLPDQFQITIQEDP